MADLQLHTLMLCDYALTAQDGKLSAMGIFSQINVSRLPAVHGRAFVVAILEADAGRHELSLQLISPSGTPLLARPPQFRIQVPPGATTANIVADLQGLEIKEIGRHRFELREGDRVLGSSPFMVNLVLRTQQPAQA